MERLPNVWNLSAFSLKIKRIEIHWTGEYTGVHSGARSLNFWHKLNRTSKIFIYQ